MNIWQKLYNLCVSGSSHNFNESELISSYEWIEYWQKVKYFVIQSSHWLVTYKESDFERYYWSGDIYSQTKEESKRKYIEKIESEIKSIEYVIKELKEKKVYAECIFID